MDIIIIADILPATVNNAKVACDNAVKPTIAAKITGDEKHFSDCFGGISVKGALPKRIISRSDGLFELEVTDQIGAGQKTIWKTVAILVSIPTLNVGVK